MNAKVDRGVFLAVDCVNVMDMQIYVTTLMVAVSVAVTTLPAIAVKG